MNDTGYLILTPDQLSDLAQDVAGRLPLERFALNRDAINTIAQAVIDKLITMRVLDTLAGAMGRCLTGVNLTLSDKAITRVAHDIRAHVAQAVVNVDARTFATMTADLLRADPLRVSVSPTQATEELDRLRPLAQFLDNQSATLGKRERELSTRGQQLDDREKQLTERAQHLDHIANTTGRPLTTAELAAALGVLPASIRSTIMHNQGHYFGVRPNRDQRGRLLWPADTLAQLSRAGKLPKAPQQPKAPPPREPAPYDPHADIEALGLSVRAHNVLLASNIQYVDQIPRDLQKLYRMPNLGRRTATEILDAIALFEHKQQLP